MSATAGTQSSSEKVVFWLGVSSLFFGVTGPFAIYFGVKAWKLGVHSARIAVSIGMGAIGCIAMLAAGADSSSCGSTTTATATVPAPDPKPAVPTAALSTASVSPAPPAPPTAEHKEEREPSARENAPVATKPLAWQTLPTNTLVEMEDRLHELSNIYAEATRLPEVMRKQGLAQAGAAMRRVQAKCKEADHDYDLRFGSFSPWPEFELFSLAGRAHVSMRGAFAHVCGVCPTLLPDAPDACKRAREPVAEAKKALAEWGSALKKHREPSPKREARD